MEHKNLIDVDIEREMKSAFIDYAMSTITARALPDVRDGLKPVHRRILYSMYNSGLTPDKPYSKSAATVGDVLKYFHPHGEAAVYDTLVRLAQDFSLRYTLVDGQGNFGSLDGDSAAAMRYTEARIQKISLYMMEDIEKDTVDFVPNYDGKYKEPSVLPARFPQLLVNGSMGIAVGMATNIPPHNLCETIDAVCRIIDDPDCTYSDLMEHIKAPDFPTGGTIVGLAGVRAAYATGRGRIKVRAKCEIEEQRDGRFHIVVTEIPYMLNKIALVEKMAELVKTKKIEGVSAISDHSDRNGLKIVVELKREANPQVILNQFYAYSPLEDVFPVNIVALVNGQPKTLGLKEMLCCYLEHQKDIVRRRTRFELNRCRRRAHILEGLKIAVDNIDRIIEIIRSSKSEDEAKGRLSEVFALTAEQSQAIVDMRLGRLTGLERDKIEQELAGLQRRIEEYVKILADEQLILEKVREELMTVRDKFGDERRTQIELIDDDMDIEDLIENEECVITHTHLGYIKRISPDEYRAQRRGGRGVNAMSTREEDYVARMFVAMTHDNLLFFTDRGRVFRLKAYTVPHASRTAKGTNLVNLLSLEAQERVTAILPVKSFDSGENLFFVTRMGTVKRVELSALKNLRKNGLRAVILHEGDALVSVLLTDGTYDLCIATGSGKANRFSEEEVRIMGRTAAGVRGISLRGDDCVVGAIALKGGENILTVTENGFGKRTPESEYSVKHRGTQGIVCHGITEKTGSLAAIRISGDDEDLLLITDDGTIIRTAAQDVRVCGRSSQGVILMRAGSAKVIDVSETKRTEEQTEQESER